jgi:hypothetical protein
MTTFNLPQFAVCLKDAFAFVLGLGSAAEGRHELAGLHSITSSADTGVLKHGRSCGMSYFAAGEFSRSSFASKSTTSSILSVIAGASRHRARIARGAAQGEAADHLTLRPFAGSILIFGSVIYLTFGPPTAD